MRRVALLRDIATEQLRVAIWAFYEALEREEKRYNPSQPRVPRGNPDGGQWTRVGGVLGGELGEESLPGGDREDRPGTRQRAREAVPRSWARRGLFKAHYQKHAKEFDAKTPEAYAEKAQKFRRYARTNKLPGVVNKDGYAYYYDPKTNTFAVYAPNGRTETLYKPKSPKHVDNVFREVLKDGGKLLPSRKPFSGRGGGGGGGFSGGPLWRPGHSLPNPLNDSIIFW